MATFTAKYLPGGATRAFGASFEEGKPAEVDIRYLEKVQGNRFFEVVGEPEQVDPDKGLHAVHKGRGVYAIMRDGTEVETGLSKKDADAFNALSEDEQRELLGKQ